MESIMSKTVDLIKCTKEEKRQLLELINVPEQDKNLVLRGQIVLKSFEEPNAAKVAENLKTTVRNVNKWRSQYIEHGVDGLFDTKRPGRQPKYGKEAFDKLTALLKTIPPDGQAYWDGKSLASQTGLPEDIIWKFTREHGIKLSRTRLWWTEIAPPFTEKGAEVVGLYLNSYGSFFIVQICSGVGRSQQLRSVVYGNDIKAVERLRQASKENNYLSLSEAVQLSIGKGKAKRVPKAKKADMSNFVKDVIGGLPRRKGQAFHVIVEGAAAYVRSEDLLDSQIPIFFHTVSTREAWLGAFELWTDMFGIGQMTIGAEDSQQNREAIEKFLKAVETAKCSPFRWKKEAITR